MSEPAGGSNHAETILGDTDLFFFFLRGGRLEVQAEKVVDAIEEGRLELKTSSEVYDDAISTFRADGVSLETVKDFVSDMESIPHDTMPMGTGIAEQAVDLYRRHGGDENSVTSILFMC